VLANRVCRRLILGFAVSYLGDGMGFVAVASYAAVPTCVMKALGKPSRNGRRIRIQEAARPNPALELPT
jgi:hypothetical protein